MNSEYGLTYEDVRLVLALVDGWPEGRGQLRVGDLEVEYSSGTAGSSREQVVPAQRRTVAAPSVGMVHRGGQAPAAGCGVETDTVICILTCDDRDVAVEAGTAGELVEWLVADGDFVEYAQTLAIVEPGQRETRA